MMFFPVFDVETVAGDTAWIRADLVAIVNDEPDGVREIYVTGVPAVVKTKVSAHDVWERVGAAIEGARNAELDLLAQGEGSPVSERDTSDDQPSHFTREGDTISGSLLDGRPFTIDLASGR